MLTHGLAAHFCCVCTDTDTKFHMFVVAELSIGNIVRRVLHWVRDECQQARVLSFKLQAP